MNQIIEFIANLIGVEAKNLDMAFALIGLTVSAVVPVWAIFLYKKKKFLDHITYNYNRFVKLGDACSHRLELRTPQLLPIGDILPNNLMFKLKLHAAIRKCSRTNPLIQMSDKDMDILMPAIINGLSMIFGSGMMTDNPGQEVDYLLAVTYEKYGSIKSQKIRVLIVTPETLKRIDNAGLAWIKFEESQHSDRIATLKTIARIRQEDPNNKAVAVFKAPQM